ncbi:MAG: hypothetical protein V4686_00605 [Patescibacteria group bacterium]
MYGDIIPPKKKYSEPSEALLQHEREEIHFTPIKRGAYQEQKNKKIPAILTALAILVVALGVYHKIFNGTTISLTPVTTRFEIQQKIPLILQNREKDSLTYSLVYVPSSTSTRNPFAAEATSSAPVITQDAGVYTLTSTSTGLTKRVRLVNKTSGAVALRATTRFDVDEVVYTLDAAASNPPTPKAELDLITSSTTYKVVGFKDTASYNLIYAIPDTTNAPTVAENAAVSTMPPADVLALMPDDAIALQKSTIYDKLLDQSAIVVFDERTLEEFLNTANIQVQEYFKVLKPFGTSISYNITIVDYTLVTSPESGKPTALTGLTLEITPIIENSLVSGQFAGFKKETMEKIQKQVAEYIVSDVSYTPFWSKSVAVEEKITVK